MLDLLFEILVRSVVGNSEEYEPLILCIYFPHRVVFLGDIGTLKYG